MPTPILATKLFVPPLRESVVRRPRLVEQLNEGLRGRLTLVAAPAGFGKTTLLSEWVADCGRPVAWLSLDEGDGDPLRFLAYLVTALQTIAPGVGDGILRGLQSAQPPSAESALTPLLNELATLPGDFALILDDYHTLDAQAIDSALTFALEHRPPQMHLIIATREDPDLPLARLRARGQLTELRAADLRFTPDEAALFLNRRMGLNLSMEDIAALEARTEGWIAGLQLAAASMKGDEDTAGFIRSFTGSHRFVLDYLVEEVLQRQTENVQTFLLRTSILDRLCGSLCDAVLADPASSAQDILAYLDHANLFVVPLDHERRWYRYHRLFGDVLQAHLIEANPEQVSSLHQRASAWYQRNGFPPEAIRHALAAEDFERAAEWIELAWSAMDISYQSPTWLGWVKALPDELVRARPVLSLGYAWALLEGDELEASESRLQDAERWLNSPTERMVVADEEQFRSLPASVATARAYRSLALGSVSDSVQHAQRALELTPDGDQVRYIQATSLLALAQYAGGDLVAAERSLADFTANLRKIGEISTLIGITFLLADIRLALGRLHEAETTYQQALRLATTLGEPMPLGTADLYRGLGELCIERGELEAAAQHLLTSQKLGDATPLVGWAQRLYVSQARLKEAQGDLDGALALLDEAERVHIRAPLPDVRPVAALKARIWIKQGRLTEAQAWARAQRLSAEDEVRFAREFELTTLAALLIAAGQRDREPGPLDEAARLLGRLLQAAETGGRMGSAIRILVLQSLASQAQDNLSHALVPLERALALAEPEGYVRTFVDEGEGARLLMQRLAQDRDHPRRGYLDRLLAAFAPSLTAPASAARHQAPEMTEPLSERELEVLRLLRSELSGPEIARHLVVSLNTLRSHTKSIFGKLGVNTRRAAVHRAEELHLI